MLMSTLGIPHFIGAALKFKQIKSYCRVHFFLTLTIIPLSKTHFSWDSLFLPPRCRLLRRPRRRLRRRLDLTPRLRRRLRFLRVRDIADFKNLPCSSLFLLRFLAIVHAVFYLFTPEKLQSIQICQSCNSLINQFVSTISVPRASNVQIAS